MRRFGLFAALSLTIWSFAPAPALAAAQELRPFVRGSYQQIVSARQGKPFIVSFWSLSCGYCMAELAMLKKLSKRYPKLDLVHVSTDTPEEEKHVFSTLRKIASSKAEVWLFADSFADRLRFEVDKNWQGELPRTYFYSSNGDVTAISGQIEQKEVERWVKEQYSSL